MIQFRKAIISDISAIQNIAYITWKVMYKDIISEKRS